MTVNEAGPGEKPPANDRPAWRLAVTLAMLAVVVVAGVLAGLSDTWLARISGAGIALTVLAPMIVAVWRHRR